MEVQLKNFIKSGNIISFVNFSGSFQKLKNNKKISYIIDDKFHQNISVRKYLEKKLGTFSHSKYVDACKMVLLDPEIINGNVSKISSTEAKKLRFVEALLLNSETFLFVNFEQGFVFKSRCYFQKLFKKLIKYGKCIILVTNDLTFLMDVPSKLVLFEKNNYLEISDFYDERLYQYVEMPNVIFYVKYLEMRGIKMEHYLESKEVLKAIYRSVTSKESL